MTLKKFIERFNKNIILGETKNKQNSLISDAGVVKLHIRGLIIVTSTSHACSCQNCTIFSLTRIFDEKPNEKYCCTQNRLHFSITKSKLLFRAKLSSKFWTSK